MLPWTSFTCYTKDNQQGYFMLSNWFSLRRLWPWMNHLPPAWQSTFRLTFQNESWYVSLEWYFIYLLFLASVLGFTYETSDFLIINNLFIYQVLCTLIYPRCSLYSLLLHICNSSGRPVVRKKKRCSKWSETCRNVCLWGNIYSTSVPLANFPIWPPE